MGLSLWQQLLTCIPGKVMLTLSNASLSTSWESPIARTTASAPRTAAIASSNPVAFSQRTPSQPGAEATAEAYLRRLGASGVKSEARAALSRAARAEGSAGKREGGTRRRARASGAPGAGR